MSLLTVGESNECKLRKYTLNVLTLDFFPQQSGGDGCSCFNYL